MSNNLMELGNFDFPAAKIKKGNKGKKKNFQGSEKAVNKFKMF